MIENKPREMIITLSILNKSGALSAAMFIPIKFGLRVKKHHIDKVNEEKSKVILFLTGTLNSSQVEFYNAFESHPKIYSVDDIELEHSENHKAKSNSGAKESTQFNGKDRISEESIQKAEEVLLNLLGPIAPIFIKSVASKTDNIGSLYLLLSEQLKDEDKKDFLDLVKD